MGRREYICCLPLLKLVYPMEDNIYFFSALIDGISLLLNLFFFRMHFSTIRFLTKVSSTVLSASGGIKVDHPKMSNGTSLPKCCICFSIIEASFICFITLHFSFIFVLFLLLNDIDWTQMIFMVCGADIVVLVAVVILIFLFILQHYGTDKVGWLFAPIVLLWFILIGGIGIFNIWKYDSSVLRAFSPVYIVHYFRRGGRDAWTSLGGIMLSITGKLPVLSEESVIYFLSKPIHDWALSVLM